MDSATLISSVRGYLENSPSRWLRFAESGSWRVATWAISQAQESTLIRSIDGLEEEVLARLLLTELLRPTTLKEVATLGDDDAACSVLSAALSLQIKRVFRDDVKDAWDKNHVLSYYNVDLEEDFFDFDQPSVDDWLPADLSPSIASYTTSVLFSPEAVNQQLILGETSEDRRPGNDLVRLDVIDIALYRALAQHPEFFSSLPWRTFEKLLADMLERFGYEVELQRGTKDGGIDLFAIRRLKPFGSQRFLLQAKRWSHKIGVEAVRQLLFLHSHHRMTKSCLATTATFTKDALALAHQYRWQLELCDVNELREWAEEISRTSKPLARR